MNPRLKWIIWVLGGLSLLCGAVLLWLFYDLPSIEPLSLHLRTPGIRITDRSGRVLYEVMRDEAGRQFSIPLDNIPLALRRATIATEDAHFYTNPGIEPAGIVRSIWINLSNGDTLAGGSTITQQVARNLLLSEEERSQRTPRRKLREMVLAWQLTGRYSKDEILALYLNQTYYGGMTYGIEVAARTYFAKSLGPVESGRMRLVGRAASNAGTLQPLYQFGRCPKKAQCGAGFDGKEWGYQP